MAYALHDWPTIPGRGACVRLALEAAGADDVDVARRPEAEGGGIAAMMDRLEDEPVRPPFALPFLEDGERVGRLPRIAAYRAGERGRPFDEEGILRRYPELDVG